MCYGPAVRATGGQVEASWRPRPYMYLLNSHPYSCQRVTSTDNCGSAQGRGLPSNLYIYPLDYLHFTEKAAQGSNDRLVTMMGVECDVNILHHLVTGQSRSVK